MRLAAALGFMLALLPFAAHSQYEQTFGAATVHYSALSTERLLPAMAKSYGITQSANRGLVNVAIEQKTADGKTTPVHATVTGNADSVGGDSAPLKFRELVEDGTVSYISEFPLSAPDTYTFTITIVPESAAAKGPAPYTLKFSQDFVGD
jgi:uncharacterized protein DUF4426